MKVLFLTREYPPFEVGGVAVHAFNLVKNISALGVSCKVLSFGDKDCSTENVTFIDPSSSIIERKNVSLGFNAKIPFDILRYSHIANNLLKKEKFDIIHVEEPYVGALVSSTRHQVKVSTFHTTSIGEIRAIVGHSFSGYGIKRAAFYSSLGVFLDFKGITSSTSLLVPTREIAEELATYYRAPENKIQVIENGVDLPELNKKSDSINAKAKLGLSSDTILILSLGRLVARKHVELLIKAMKMIQEDKLGKYHLTIVGEGPEKLTLQQLINEYGLGHIIELSGRVSDEQKAIYYQAADIFVLTSSYEGFPINMLEAMSYGVAIINSRIESVSSLREGIDSLAFSPMNTSELSMCLKSLLNDSTLRTRLSLSARKFAERHDWKRIAEKTRKAYENLLQ
jgi:glycosyltransferase involved in cell wall biosynthesis